MTSKTTVKAKFRTWILGCLLVLFTVGSWGVGLAGASEPEKSPIFVDTQIGSEISDAFALGLALAIPEAEIVGITTVGGDAANRAWMVCRMLTHSDRGNIPVAYGRGEQPNTKIDWQIQYRRHPAVVWDRTVKPVSETAVDLLHEQLKKRPGKVTLVATGAMTNLAQLLQQRPDAKSLIKQIVIAASPDEITSDRDAAEAVLQSGVSLVVVPVETRAILKLGNIDLERIFSACNPLSYQVQALYQLSDDESPSLQDALAVALAAGHNFCQLEDRKLTIDEDGTMTVTKGTPNAAVATVVQKDDLIDWYVERLSEFGSRNIPAPPKNLSTLIERQGLPLRVHVFEDYESDIEKRWWLTGKLETEDVPEGSRRACRAVLTQDYDDRMGDTKTTYAAVVFNPVPGPPMGKNTRLSFRYKLNGSDRLRVQLFSLSNGYHRYLSLEELPQGTWQQATVDMTEMRRPDGSGGPLAEDERIDDIQFYVDPRAELLIDDIVLYDAAPEGEQRPFPKRFLFTGWFDTGQQGREWPGDFTIVEHEKPLTWKAARSVLNEATGRPWLRIHMRGQRRLDERIRLRFRYRLSGGTALQMALVDSESQTTFRASASELEADQWAETSVDFQIPIQDKDVFADEIHIIADRDAELTIDDLLLYVPGEN